MFKRFSEGWYDYRNGSPFDWGYETRCYSLGWGLAGVIFGRSLSKTQRHYIQNEDCD